MATYYVGNIPVTDELYHHGILGQKWGIRRYQNEDGTLTDAGIKRYRNPRNIQKELNSLDKKEVMNIGKMGKVLNKALKIKFDGDDFLAKHPDENRTNAQNRRMGRYVKNLRTQNLKIQKLGEERKAIHGAKADLIKAAISNGMSVKISAIPRFTESFGKRVLNESLGWAMGVPIATIAPVGVGISPRTGQAIGTKFEVYSNK